MDDLKKQVRLKADYAIKVLLTNAPEDHPVTVQVKSLRYMDGQAFGAKTVMAALAKCAKWIENH